MKKAIILLVVGVVPFTMMAQDSLQFSSNIPVRHVLDKSSTTSKSRKKWIPRSGRASSVQVRKINKVKYQTALYSNFGVVTVLSGPERMRQIILKRRHNGSPKPVMSALKYKIKGKKTIHKYPWGSIVSYKSGKQKVKVK